MIPSYAKSTMEQARVVEKKPKVVFVLGATATGKSKLAIAIAKRFDGEVINADKIQVHDGAPIITNKVTEEEQAGVPHHLLSVLPPDAEFTAEDFRREAAGAVAGLLAAGRLPVVAGGSNTYIEALVEGDGAAFRAAHDVLFVWVDAAPELLAWYTAARVDEMVARGLVAEARSTFDAGAGAEADYTRGVHRAIGLPEMHAYLVAERGGAGQAELAALLARAVLEIKKNTFALARAQVEKIRRLSTLDGWDVRRVDVTAMFARMAEGGDASDKETWEALVWEPCEEMVRRFLETVPAALSQLTAMPALPPAVMVSLLLPLPVVMVSLLLPLPVVMVSLLLPLPVVMVSLLLPLPAVIASESTVSPLPAVMVIVVLAMMGMQPLPLL